MTEDFNYQQKEIFKKAETGEKCPFCARGKLKFETCKKVVGCTSCALRYYESGIEWPCEAWKSRAEHLEKEFHRAWGNYEKERKANKQFMWVVVIGALLSLVYVIFFT